MEEEEALRPRRLRGGEQSVQECWGEAGRVGPG